MDNSTQGSIAPLRASFFSDLRSGLILFLLMTLITGIVYPLTLTAVAFAFPAASTGSVLRDGHQVIGSDLIGQPFNDARYFWGRPSATTPAYNAMAGGGSNLATTNPSLVDAVRDRIKRLHAIDPDNTLAIPIDLVTASASGLDPHISPAAARYQAGRIARLRGLTEKQVHELIRQHTESPTLGILGQARVHVLRLNRSLDALKHD